MPTSRGPTSLLSAARFRTPRKCSSRVRVSPLSPSASPRGNGPHKVALHISTISSQSSRWAAARLSTSSRACPSSACFRLETVMRSVSSFSLNWRRKTSASRCHDRHAPSRTCLRRSSTCARSAAVESPASESRSLSSPTCSRSCLSQRCASASSWRSCGSSAWRCSNTCCSRSCRASTHRASPSAPRSLTRASCCSSASDRNTDCSASASPTLAGAWPRLSGPAPPDLMCSAKSPCSCSTWLMSACASDSWRASQTRISVLQACSRSCHRPRNPSRPASWRYPSARRVMASSRAFNSRTSSSAGAATNVEAVEAVFVDIMLAPHAGWTGESGAIAKAQHILPA
mmetsp:Transcript_89361/g.251630  ORF Transcript_89361/g.251630 Transcript_89361/m.251630 type:complete len:344 (-) Transcript_89361:3-1034(-)